MLSLTSLTDFPRPIVADTSAIINLLATGVAPTILHALPIPLVVVDIVEAELESGRARGRRDADGLRDLVADRLVEIVTLGDAATQYFEGLVIGHASETLDDGEAATIASALERAGTALIDERKATRICGARYPQLSICDTLDILLSPSLRKLFGKDALSVAVFNAVRGARMSVSSRHLEEVLKVLGHERAELCNSLPKSARVSRIPSQRVSIGRHHGD